jgi:tRNA G18 (ribose-2'-O)-methylase SpoU
MIIVLDNIRSCHNVGSILRTVDCAGGKEVYLCGYTPGPLNKYGFENTKLTKVSLGAEDTVEWKHFENTLDAVKNLKSEGYMVLAIEQCQDSQDIYDLQIDKRKVALIFGNEKEGVSSEVLNIVDGKVEIPMFGEKKSLNVATTVGVVMFLLKAKI